MTLTAYKERSFLNTANLIRVFLLLLSFIYVHAIFYDKGALYTAFTDDFYYYLKIAKNAYNGKGLSFSEGTITNGYQPLFQYLVLALYYISRWLHLDVLILSRLIFGIIFYASGYLLYRRIKPETRISLLVFCLAILSYFTFSYNGMESLLIIPFLAVVFIAIMNGTLKNWLVGLVIAVAFFIRIDSIILLTPIAFIYLLRQGIFKSERRWKIISSVGAGLLLIPLYMLLNYHFHDVFFPISGIAKSVTHVRALHSATFTSIMGFDWNAQLMVLVALVMGILLMLRIKKSYYTYLMLLIVLFYIQNALRSDWAIWDWYLYPFSVLLFVSAYVLNEKLRLQQSSKSIFPLVILGAINSLLFVKTFFYLKPFEHSMVKAAFRIQEFENSHKGTYAMGDRAGVVGYTLASNLIQLEGLVMDKKYLKKLATAQTINELLSDYKVDYYISTNPARVNDSTFIVKEPRQSHGASPSITDTIQWKIVDQFNINTGETKRIETVIFKVP